MRNRQPARVCFPIAGLLLLGLVFCSAGVGMAFPQTVGPYRVDIEVRTSLMLPIPQAQVQARLSGNRIKISAYAPGYLFQRTEISVKPGTLYYSAFLVLPDVPKRFDVMDFQYKPIASSYFDQHQGGTPPDQYAINLFLPVKSWPHPSPANLIVNQPGYGIPIQNSCEITVLDEFYKIRMLIDRAVLDDPNDEILVYVNTAEIIPPTTTQRWIETVRELETRNPLAAEVLARALLDTLPPDLDAATLPESLGRLVAERQRFESLHHGTSLQR